MKITFDKISTEPCHSLSKKETKDILDNVPDDWIKGFDSIRFCSAIFGTPKFYGKRPVEVNHWRLNIHSRGLSKKKIIKAILLELAQRNCGDVLLREVSHNSMTKNQFKKLNKLIKPIYEKLVSELN